MPTSCILCAQDDLRLIAALPSEALNQCYQEQYGIDTRREFETAPLIKAYACPSCGLVQFLPCVAGSADFYAQFQRFDWYYLEDKPDFAFALRYLEQGMRVLEVGCGAGFFATHLPHCDYTGLETSPNAVERGRAAGRAVHSRTIENFAAEHPGEYDAVCAFQVLEHVTMPREFLQAMVDSLAPGGLLLLSVPSLDSFVEWVPNYVINMPPHHITQWRDESLGAIGTIFGLQPVTLEHEELQPYHEDLFMRAMLAHGLWSVAGKPQPLVDRSELARTIEAKAKELVPLLKPGMTGPKVAPRGHSVMACFRKP